MKRPKQVIYKGKEDEKLVDEAITNWFNLKKLVEKKVKEQEK